MNILPNMSVKFTMFNPLLYFHIFLFLLVCKYILFYAFYLEFIGCRIIPKTKADHMLIQQELPLHIINSSLYNLNSIKIQFSS